MSEEKEVLGISTESATELDWYAAYCSTFKPWEEMKKLLETTFLNGIMYERARREHPELEARLKENFEHDKKSWNMPEQSDLNVN